MKISIIIPTLNEASTITQTLAVLRELAGELEVIVVDGGSTDGTIELARRGCVTVLSAHKGRAAQMNHGAAAAQGDVLLFLHADTRLPPHVYTAITAALVDQEVAGGCFQLRFDHRHPVLRLYAFFTRFKAPLFHYGDSAYFVRKDVFVALQGYQPLPIMEDIDFFLRMCKRYKIAIVDAPVVTSARRFLKNGVVRQQAQGFLLVLMFLCGMDAAQLKEIYGRISK
jgi:rSAM/selenodomain-associated transferase 2